MTSNGTMLEFHANPATVTLLSSNKTKVRTTIPRITLPDGKTNRAGLHAHGLIAYAPPVDASELDALYGEGYTDRLLRKWFPWEAGNVTGQMLVSEYTKRMQARPESDWDVDFIKQEIATEVSEAVQAVCDNGGIKVPTLLPGERKAKAAKDTRAAIIAACLNTAKILRGLNQTDAVIKSAMIGCGATDSEADRIVAEV